MINMNKKRLLHAPMTVRAAALLFITLMGSTLVASEASKKRSEPKRAEQWVQEKAKQACYTMAELDEQPKQHCDNLELTVYEEYGMPEGSAKSSGRFFLIPNTGGIFFPSGTFDSLDEKDELKFAIDWKLHHEVGHHYNGDHDEEGTFDGRGWSFPYTPRGSKEWFRKEYNAEKRAEEALLAEGKLKVIESRLTEIGSTLSVVREQDPYAHGATDTFATLCKDNPNNKELQKIKNIISSSIDLEGCELKTWKQRYDECVKRYNWKIDDEYEQKTPFTRTNHGTSRHPSYLSFSLASAPF